MGSFYNAQRHWRINVKHRLMITDGASKAGKKEVVEVEVAALIKSRDFWLSNLLQSQGPVLDIFKLIGNCINTACASHIGIGGP